jgi:hypothetical protein
MMHTCISSPTISLLLLLLLLAVYQSHEHRAIALSSSFTKAPKLFFPNAVPVTSQDTAVLQKQTGQVAPSLAAIGIPATCKCQHGYPQVFLMNPIFDKRMNSGLVKLTCPLLVMAIDELEDEGYISKFTEWVQQEEYVQTSVQESHRTHATVRKQLILSDDNNNSTTALQSLTDKLGENGAQAFLNSGIAGASIDKPDVKCLHAWLGDYLYRSTDNVLGGEVAHMLEQERGIPMCGTADCHKFCNPTSTVLVEPPKARNKQRLKTKKERTRRKRNKETMAS